MTIFLIMVLLLFLLITWPKIKTFICIHFNLLPNKKDMTNYYNKIISHKQGYNHKFEKRIFNELKESNFLGITKEYNEILLNLSNKIFSNEKIVDAIGVKYQEILIVTNYRILKLGTNEFDKSNNLNELSIPLCNIDYIDFVNIENELSLSITLANNHKIDIKEIEPQFGAKFNDSLQKALNQKGRIPKLKNNKINDLENNPKKFRKLNNKQRQKINLIIKDKKDVLKNIKEVMISYSSDFSKNKNVFEDIWLINKTNVFFYSGKDKKLFQIDYLNILGIFKSYSSHNKIGILCTNMKSNYDLSDQIDTNEFIQKLIEFQSLAQFNYKNKKY